MRGTGLEGGAGSHQGRAPGFPREQPHFPSLRRLLGGLRACVPGPGPAHLCLLPHPVSLPAGRLLSMGPYSLGYPVLLPHRRSQCPQPGAFLTPDFLLPSPASGTFFSSRFSSPEPSARQPPARSWKPSPIWALVRAPLLPVAQMDKLRPRGKGKAWAHSLKPVPFPRLGPLPEPPEAPTCFSSLEFWSSSLNTKAQPGPSEGPLLPRLKPRSPQELDQGTGAALCFFNPLFPGDLGPTKREKFKRSFKVRVSTETSSPLSPPAVPPPPVPVLPGTAPNQTERLPSRQLLRRESSVGYRVPGGTGPSLPPLPSLQEVDCGSPSSSEEEGVPGSQGSPATSPRLGRRRPLLRSMSAAFCSLLAPERQVGRAAAALMQDRHTAVGQLVQDLLTQVRAGPETQELQGIREALSRARAMLSAELGPEKLLPPERLGETPARGSAGSALSPYSTLSASPHCQPVSQSVLRLYKPTLSHHHSSKFCPPPASLSPSFQIFF